MLQAISHRLEAEGKEVIFSSGVSNRQVTKVRVSLRSACVICLTVCAECLQLLAHIREEGHGSHRPAGTVMLVIGIPNVGKSTVIRGLKHACGLSGRGKGGRGPTKGRKAGVTRYVSAFAVSKSPPLYLMDSPGILMPKIEDIRNGVKLALTGALPDAALPVDELAHFLICHARDRGSKQFKRALQLEAVPSDSWVLLQQLAERWGLLAEGGVLDTDAAAQQLVTLFRLGKLGRYSLDEV
jgi:ribosome biogenesis GTPase A